MDKEIWKEIGLSEYEAEIYLALLQYGQISAYELANKVGLYRQVTYDALNRLTEKGYVSSVKEGKVNLYSAIDPKLILEYLDETLEKYKHFLPELIKLRKKGEQPLVVETYKGKNVLRVSFRDIVNTLKNGGGENLCTAVDEFIPYSWPQKKSICDQYERDILRYGIKERVIVKEGSKGLFQKGTSKYKKIPEKFFNPNPVSIYGNNVQILVFGNPDYLIIIRNEGVADSYRKQFELLWSVAKK